jgi:hypothetical protein
MTGGFSSTFTDLRRFDFSKDAPVLVLSPHNEALSGKRVSS